MRLLFLLLLVFVGLIQYPLWLGKGGWFKVWDLQKQVASQREVNDRLRARNAALDAEVQDLKNGTGAIEERARGELGMMKEGEVFVQILPQNVTPPAGASQSLPVTQPPAPGAPPAAAKPPGPSASKPPAAASKPPAAASKPPAGAAKPAQARPDSSSAPKPAAGTR